MSYQAAASIFDAPLAAKAERRLQDAEECLRAAQINMNKLRAIMSLPTDDPAGPEEIVHWIKSVRLNLFQAQAQYEMLITPPELRYYALETIAARPAADATDEHRLVASQCL